MSKPDSGAIVVFDGVCVLCNGWVRFLVARDRDRRYRFAAMQTLAGRRLLECRGMNPDDPVSFLLVDEEGAWTDTQAIARVLAGLGGGWRLASTIITLVPQTVRDAAYRSIARNRYRWFGQKKRLSPERVTRVLQALRVALDELLFSDGPGNFSLRALLELIASDLHEDVHRYLEESSIDLLDKGSGCRLLEELTEAGIGEDLTDDQEAHVAVLLHESA